MKKSKIGILFHQKLIFFPLSVSSNLRISYLNYFKLSMDRGYSNTSMKFSGSHTFPVMGKGVVEHRT